ncbi:MAG TPA: ABC transporter permease [Geminicoccaceae bacterium]|nr:ABC transporter permease [Geminicoccus sp.]HMU51804.1 ABC transporter permease [Geminicoccaceae bacterium]
MARGQAKSETYIASILVWMGAIAIALPLVLTLYISFFDEELIVFPPRGFTVRWYFEAVEKFRSSALTSLGIAAAAVVGSLIIGVTCGIGLHRYRFRGRSLAFNLVAAPMIVPGVALGLSIAIFAIWLTRQEVLDLRASVLPLICAHVLIALPWVVRLCVASLANYDPAAEEAAASLGAHPAAVIWHITLPAMRPGIIAAALFAFVVSFENLEMTMFLLKPGVTTLPVTVLGYLSFRVDPMISALAVLQIAFIAATLIFVDRFFRIGRVVG